MRLQQGSAAAPSKRKSKVENKVSQYDITTACRSTGLFATLDARQVLQPRELVRRLVRSILPGLACIPGTALLSYYQLTTQDRSPKAGNLLASSPHDGNLMHAADMYITKATQSDVHDLPARFNG